MKNRILIGLVLGVLLVAALARRLFHSTPGGIAVLALFSISPLIVNWLGGALINYLVNLKAKGEEAATVLRRNK